MPRRLLLAAASAALATACSAQSNPGPATAAVSQGPAATAAVGTATAPPSGTCTGAKPPHYRHVIWIWMENRSYSEAIGPGSGGSGLARFAHRCGVATNYEAVTHPSLPNYIAATSGSTHGITSDCSPSDCPVRHNSLYAQVTRAGLRWRGYAESMQHRCDHASYDHYAARHNPAVYYPPIANQCAGQDVALGGNTGPFATALAKRRLPAFAFVTPNLCHDGHDCSMQTADAWATPFLRRIVTSPAYKAGNTAVFVTWDEGIGSDQRVATIVIAPSVRPGTRAGARFTHYSLLRTTEQLLGLSYLGKAKAARSMRAAFHL